MPHRDEQQDEGYASDEDFIRGGGRDARTAPAPRRRPSALTSVLRVLVLLLLMVIVIGGGLYLAIQYRIIDPAAFGLDDVFAMHMRPNRRLAPQSVYDAKVTDYRRRWPSLTSDPW